MELLVKPEMLTSYIYGPTFGNAETVVAVVVAVVLDSGSSSSSSIR